MGRKVHQQRHSQSRQESNGHLFSTHAQAVIVQLFGRGFRPDASRWRDGIGRNFEVMISMYDASVGVFVPYLRNLSALLDKGVAYAESRKFNPAVLLGMRMAPNMYDLAQQVGEACRHATVAPALLAQREPVALPALEHDMAGLQARIATSIEFIEGLPRAEIDAAAELNVFFRLKNGTELPFTGRTLLLTFSVPQFFFHVTTAYDLLRHAGVELVKRDFLGPRER
ncbi:DUF1993 domain-containing protein [Bradyrhizobium niftali]|uniref:DUF1993 domain-containing protein n=2 Tax=Bradyrhizobium niftali TaxID=2560055 RepID=A0A4Y9LW43_9BRAD|nr:DUF1993 domain-containing protein [Bradyrhizobium niftali]